MQIIERMDANHAAKAAADEVVGDASQSDWEEGEGMSGSEDDDDDGLDFGEKPKRKRRRSGGNRATPNKRSRNKGGRVRRLEPAPLSNVGPAMRAAMDKCSVTLFMNEEWYFMCKDEIKKADYRADIKHYEHLLKKDPKVVRIRHGSSRCTKFNFTMNHIHVGYDRPDRIAVFEVKKISRIATTEIPLGEAPPPGSDDHEAMFRGKSTVIKVEFGDRLA